MYLLNNKYIENTCVNIKFKIYLLSSFAIFIFLYIFYLLDIMSEVPLKKYKKVLKIITKVYIICYRKICLTAHLTFW